MTAAMPVVRWISANARAGVLSFMLLASLLMPGCGKKDNVSKPEASRSTRLASADEWAGFDPTTIPGRIHLIQPSDTLWSLSETYYGNSRHWRKIHVANRRRLTDPTNLPVGMKLIIP